MLIVTLDIASVARYLRRPEGYLNSQATPGHGVDTPVIVFM